MIVAASAVRDARLGRLRPRHIVDAAQIVSLSAVLLSVEVGLRTIGVQRVASILRVGFLPGQRINVDETPAPIGARRHRWLRNAARLLRRWPLDATCLRRSLLTGWILRSHDPVLMLGVRTHEGRIEAHAWIRLGDRDLDTGADRFVAFDRIDVPASAG